MFDLDKWEEIFDTLQKNKLRTALTAFGVFWGILMLIILLGAGQGLQNGVAKSMLLDATNSIWFFTGRTSIPYKGMPPGRALQFTEEDLKAIEENIDGIEIMSPENWLSGNYTVSYNGHHRRGHAGGDGVVARSISRLLAAHQVEVEIRRSLAAVDLEHAARHIGAGG